MTIPIIPCNPVVDLATGTTFEMSNSSKPANAIYGVVTRAELEFFVQNLPRTSPQSGCRGRWLFDRMMEHFLVEGTAIDAIIGSWTYGDNLRIVNTLTSPPNNLPLAEAVRRTLTSHYAATWNYTNTTIVRIVGGSGNYSDLRVRFTR